MALTYNIMDGGGGEASATAVITDINGENRTVWTSGAEAGTEVGTGAVVIQAPAGMEVPTTIVTEPAKIPVGKSVKNVYYRGNGGERIKVTEYTDGTTLEEASPVIAVPGSTGTSTVSQKTLARDTFINTFALSFGADEASKDYVGKLYSMVSDFYNTGSTVDEAINLSVRKARVDNAIPEFTARFKGLFALDDMLKAGKPVEVPTVAEYIASEAEMGRLLTEAGMGELATQDFLGDVIGKYKSVAEVGRIITGVFSTIDNAPEPYKKVLAEKYPTVTRTGLAAALIGGTAGATQLEKEVKNLGVIAAARQQGVAITAEQAANISALGYDYKGSLSGMGKVAQAAPTLQKISEMKAGKALKPEEVSAQLQSAVFGQDVQAQSLIDQMTQEELNRFRSSAGTYGSKSLMPSQARGAGLI